MTPVRWLLAGALGAAGLVACSDPAPGPSFPSAHPRIYIGENHDRLAAALAAQTPSAVRFQDVVERYVKGDDLYGFEAWNAALLGQLTGDPKYCTAAVAAIDAQVTAATTAIAGGGEPDVAHDSYLYVGDLIGDLAITYDWCSDRLTGAQQQAWLAYGQQAVFNVWNHDQASWGGTAHPWDGWAVDDPSDNYYYSFLRATMLFGLAAHADLPAADQWLTQFHDAKVMNQLVPTFDSDLVGGGSREGTSYGVSMRRLFELYDWWQASTGEELATKTPHTRASLLDLMHSVLPTLDRVAPTGDQARDSTAALFDYHRHYLNVLATEFPDDPQVPRAQAMLAASTVPEMSLREMYVYDFLYDHSDITPKPLDGLGTAYYAPGTGQLFARSGWDTHATWWNMIAGPYTESHGHQDQGALTIYKDGWLAYDAVVESGSGLTQDTTAHGTVRIVNGQGADVPQAIGSASAVTSLHSGPGWLDFAADLSALYAGTAATHVQREVVYVAPDCLVVYDHVATASDAKAIWQLAMPGEPALSDGRAVSTASGHTLTIARVGGDPVDTSVHRYADDGGEYAGGFRLDETLAGGDRHLLHVIWIDNAVGSVAATGDTGALVTFADGSTATVTFGPNADGGTLAIVPVGQPRIDATLAPGIDSLPE